MVPRPFPAARFSRRATLVAAVALGAFASRPARSQESPDRGINIGTVEAIEYKPYAIAVPPFQSTSGGLSVDLAQVISNDLYLSGFFSLPKNQQFVAENQALDLKDGKIHFADWFRSGVTYIVKGQYAVAGGKLEAEVRTYDSTSGTYIFGKRYVDFSPEQGRNLAHYAANEIIERVTGYPGAAQSKLVFTRETGVVSGRQAKEIFVTDADGANLAQLTTDGNLASTPTWGANGTEIYYTTYKDFNPDLAGMFLDGSYAWFLSRRPGLNYVADWHQAKKLIALTLSKDGNPEIYLMNREGKDLKRLTYTRSIDSSPSWSPTGDQIAFTSDRTGKPQIFVMDETGVEVRQLTRMPDWTDAATWSPRGDRIAFTSRVNGVFQIFTVGSTGEDLRQLTRGSHNCEDPAWAPNGWVLAYTSDETGTKQINTMFVDGRLIARLTTGGASFSPDWSPSLP